VKLKYNILRPPRLWVRIPFETVWTSSRQGAIN